MRISDWSSDVCSSDLVRRDRTRAVARMDAGFLDMLEHARNDDIGAVGDRVDIDLDRVTQILIDQNWCITRDLNRRLDIFLELRATVDELHRPPAEHIADRKGTRLNSSH